MFMIVFCLFMFFLCFLFVHVFICVCFYLPKPAKAGDNTFDDFEEITQNNEVDKTIKELRNSIFTPICF